MNKEKTGHIKTAYQLRDHDRETSIAHYAEWAESYDEDTASYGYVGPRSAAKVLARHVSGSSRVLDIGCGTGLVGEALSELGFERVDGTDLSPAMVEAARGKEIYERISVDDLLAGLAVEDDTYDAAITVGTFGPVGPTALPECLRVVRGGGILCISINEIFVEELDFLSALERLVGDGLADLLECERHPHLLEGGHDAYISVLRKR